MAYVEREGLRIGFDVIGDGPAVVLLHSFLCSGEMWRGQVGPLAACYRVINIDCRGHGASSPASKAFTLYDLMDDAFAVLDALGVDQAVWAGLSIGGMIALRAALRAPHRLRALVLIDTDAGSEGLSNQLKYKALAALVHIFGSGPVLPQIARLMFGPTTRREQPDLVAEWVDRFSHVDIPSALLALRALNERDDLSPKLAEVDLPALVLVGSEDHSLPPERSRRLAGALPRAWLVEIQGAGHLSSLEQPTAVTNAMLDFLRRTDTIEQQRGGPTRG